MPSSILYTVTRPPKPKKDWLYKPTEHGCDHAGCPRVGTFGATFPLTPTTQWFCRSHAPVALFPMLRPRLRAAFRLDDEAAA